MIWPIVLAIQEGWRSMRNSQRNKQEQWDQAVKIMVGAAREMYEMLYDDNTETYVHCDGELVDHIANYPGEVSAMRLYGTSKTIIGIDAYSVIESACEELHEDAIGACDHESLQKLIDEWCLKQTGTATYYPDTKVGVIVPERAGA